MLFYNIVNNQFFSKVTKKINIIKNGQKLSVTVYKKCI